MNLKLTIAIILFIPIAWMNGYAQGSASTAAARGTAMDKFKRETLAIIQASKKNVSDTIPNDSIATKIDSVKANLSKKSELLAGQQKSELQKYVSEQKQALNQQSQTLKSGLTKNISEVKGVVSDTVPVVKRIDIPPADSLSIRIENGKVILPQNMTDLQKLTDQLPDVSGQKPTVEKLSREALPITLPRTDALQQAKDNLDNLNAEKLKSVVENKTNALLEENESYKKIQDKADSVQELVEKGQKILEDISAGSIDFNHIYSTKSLKKLYDSLGISKVDSVLALASRYQEVSSEELLQQINAAFPGEHASTLNTLSNLSNPSDLESLRSSIPSNELPVNMDAVASARDRIPANLSDMKLSMDELSQLAPLSGFQLPTDSIPGLDSLRALEREIQKIQLDEEGVEEQIKSAVIKQKPTFWDNAYVEGILSYAKNTDFNSFHLSPSFGYRIKNNFSMGIGPNILINQVEKTWDFSVGFRAFAKYELFDQRLYLQVEDMVDPAAVSQEYIANTQHSILTGVGALLPITRSLAINVSVLYRANNDAYSAGRISPWVIRIGLSSIKRKDDYTK